MTRKELFGTAILGIAFFVGFPLAYFLLATHFGAFSCNGIAGFICGP
jgi:hypothetical protein